MELPLDRDDMNVIFGILFDIHRNVLKVIALLEDDGEEEAEEDA
ncbi:MAG TPA: hypothetical protein VMT59_12450 [Gaiellaceae bacterium]|nr:hypothetical protein [Gaiellaceae bacterium]